MVVARSQENTFCHPLFIIAPLNTPDGEASSMSNLLLSSESLLICEFTYPSPLSSGQADLSIEALPASQVRKACSNQDRGGQVIRFTQVGVRGPLFILRSSAFFVKILCRNMCRTVVDLSCGEKHDKEGTVKQISGLYFIQSRIKSLNICALLGQ